VVNSLIQKGVTVYSALKSMGLKSGDTIVIHGSGGGLGHLGRYNSWLSFEKTFWYCSIKIAVQYAVAMGFNVIAIGEYTFIHPFEVC